jgi:hypothetical protein
VPDDPGSKHRGDSFYCLNRLLSLGRSSIPSKHQDNFTVKTNPLVEK